jgi:predicted anti-sigma-YlaC factor YlaD
MTCRELVERVTDYLEGRLAPLEVELVTAHLQHCDGCTEYIEQMRATIRVTAAARRLQDVPDREALRQSFRRHRQS